MQICEKYKPESDRLIVDGKGELELLRCPQEGAVVAASSRRGGAVTCDDVEELRIAAGWAISDLRAAVDGASESRLSMVFRAASCSTVRVRIE